MIFRTRRLCVALLLVMATAGATKADEGVALRTSILAAMATTSSFQIDVSNPQGINGTITFLAPTGRVKAQGSAGPHAVLLYAVGGYEYQQFDGSSWQRRKLPASGLVIDPLSTTASVVPLADKHEGGSTLGAFSATTSLPIPGVGTIPNVAMECTYEKPAMLLHGCATQYGTFTFGHYNDPKNVVELPPETKNASELPPLTSAGFPQGK